MTVTEIVTTRNPTFAADSRLDDFISLAVDQTDTAFFGTDYNLAVALRTMHDMEMASRGGAGGAISSETEGKLERRYAVSVSDDPLKSTSYGRELTMLMRQYSGLSARNRMMG